MKYIFIFLLLPFLVLSQNKGASPLEIKMAQSTSGTTYAVVVGISDYQDPGIPDLRYADKDAEAFANFLRSPSGGSLDGDHLQVLTNTQATAGRIAEALDGLIEKAKKDDQVIIYFSGHGDVEGKKLTQPGFLLCWDSPSRVYMGGGTYSLSFLQEVVSTLSVQNQAKVIVITDACHAGKLSGSQIGGAQLTTANLAKQYANEIKILSCQPNEYSLEGEQWGGGRGVFSYHLVDGLFGLADRNNDGQITLGEIDRYLEDHVTGEAAPQSQVPILLGNKTDRLATVNASIFADLKKNKTGNMEIFAATESRGFEEEILSKADNGIKVMYKAFKQAVAEKRFLSPENDCAEKFYADLEKVEILAPLRGIMKRNYAAALQDDAQQAMNIWLKADVQQLECIGKSLKLEPIPQQLGRAMELLGEGHYMYRSLQARRLLFEGISEMKHRNPDEALGRKCLSLFRQSLALEPQSALPWHWMSHVYANNLRMSDSAFVCARKTGELAPSWVLPMVDLGYALTSQRKIDLAKLALHQAEAIDPQHPYVINSWAGWYQTHPEQENKEKALLFYKKYQESGGPLFPCWYNDYGLLLINLGNFDEAELIFKKVISLDSTSAVFMGNLGVLYNESGRFAEAEPVLIKAIALDSTYVDSWNNLGVTYLRTGRFVEAVPILEKAIGLDSTSALNWSNLGSAYNMTNQFVKAELVFIKALALDSMNVSLYNNLGYLYIQTRRYSEAETVLKKAIAIDSTYLSALVNLGNLYRETHHYDESEKMYQKIIALDANFLSAYRNYARLKIKTGNLQMALSCLEQAIQKGYNDFQGMQTDTSFAPLRYQTVQWEALMKKYFADKMYYNLACEQSLKGELEKAFESLELSLTNGWKDYDWMQQDTDLAKLREQENHWKVIMKKYFPDKFKD